MPQMKAITYARFGGPEVLCETLVDIPVPKHDEILVSVHAASVNGYDVGARSGALKLFTGRKFPKRTGLDFAGEVVMATASSSFKPGDRVWGVTPLHQSGSIAELITVAPMQLAHAPAGLDLVLAASLPVVGSTVITALRDLGDLKRGERLLVRGASGGVGCAAVQLGRALGAHVTGLASASSLGFVRDLGAHEAFDYAHVDAGSLEPFDVILDTVGSDLWVWRRTLAAGGRMMAIVPDLKRPLSAMAYIAWSRVHGGRRVRFFSDRPDTRLLTDLAGYVGSGAIWPVIDQIFPMTAIADAHRAMETGGRRGKLVVQMT